MRKISFLLAMVMVMSLLTGCAGTPVVYYSDCTCPEGSHDAVVAETRAPAAVETEAAVAAEGAVKTGLAVLTGLSGENASADADGKAEFDVTLVAVLVDDNGVITDCAIDSIGPTITFNNKGELTSDFAADVLTKQELGYDYGMVAYQASTMEWFEQADALAAYAVGKTVEELKNGAVDETGHAVDVDLASSATIYLGSYVAAIEEAVANAQHLGAQAGDELILSSVNSTPCTTSGTDNGEEVYGSAQLMSDVVAMTMKDGVITSAVIDSLSANVQFDSKGVIVTDMAAGAKTKNQLGYDYGMVAYQASNMEWFEQTANFCAYITGKTPAEVAGIAVDEGTKTTDADLAAGCTIAIGGFQALIAKAAQK